MLTKEYGSSHLAPQSYSFGSGLSLPINGRINAIDIAHVFVVKFFSTLCFREAVPDSNLKGLFTGEVLAQLFAGLLLAATIVFGQAANGVVTGTVADQTGAVVANAAVEGTNSQTGVVYPTLSTSTGNYTLKQVGMYEINIKVSGSYMEL